MTSCNNFSKQVNSSKSPINDCTSNAILVSQRGHSKKNLGVSKLVRSKGYIVGIVSLTLTGCLISPSAITSDEVANHLNAIGADDLSRGQEVVAGAVDIYEAMARVLKYNLDYQTQRRNEALSLAQLSVSSLDMLPELSLNHNYNGRDKYNASKSVPLTSRKKLGEVPGQDYPFTTSSSLNTSTSNVGFSWNILDFGLSYVRAKEAANNYQIAQLHTRRNLNNILIETQDSFWKALASQQFLSEINPLQERVRKAIRSNAELAERKAVDPVWSLTNQRELLGILSELQGIKLSLITSKQRLAYLMNSPVNGSFMVKANGEPITVVGQEKSIAELINFAYGHRPDILENAYEAKTTEGESVRALLETLPSLNVFARGNHTNDQLLYSNDWLSWGTGISWNLIDVFSYPTRRDASKASADATKARGKALAATIAAEIVTSRMQYGESIEKLRLANQNLKVQSQLTEQSRTNAQNERSDSVSLLKEELRLILANVRRHTSVAEAETAAASFNISVGVDILNTVDFDFDTMTVAELAGKLRETKQSHEVFLDQSDRSIVRVIETQVPQYEYLVQGDDYNPTDGIEYYDQTAETDNLESLGENIATGAVNEGSIEFMDDRSGFSKF